jgi:type IV pilus assembly protein PilM
MANLVSLDLSRTSIRAVEVSGAHTAQPVIQRYGEIPLPAETVFDGEVTEQGPFVDAIKRLWKQAGFSTHDVIFGVGNRKVLVREATVPHMPNNVRQESLPYQVQNIISTPVEETLFDFLPLEMVQAENPQTAQVGPADKGLLIAASRDGITATAKALQKAGLIVQTVDLSAFALSRLLALAHIPGTAAIINIGASTTIVVVLINGVPQFIRMISSGGDDITRALTQPLSMTFPQAEALKIELGLYAHDNADERTKAAEQVVRENIVALIRNIQATFDYYAGQHADAPITRILLSGGGSRLGGINTVLQQAFSIGVDYAQPLKWFSAKRNLNTREIAGRALELTTALGLTIGGQR